MPRTPGWKAARPPGRPHFATIPVHSCTLLRTLTLSPKKRAEPGHTPMEINDVMFEKREESGVCSSV